MIVIRMPATIIYNDEMARLDSLMSFSGPTSSATVTVRSMRVHPWPRCQAVTLRSKTEKQLTHRPVAQHAFAGTCGKHTPRH